MTPDKIKETLESMKGRYFIYAKKKHFVKSFVVDDEKESFSIVTDINTYDRKFASANEFFTYWQFSEMVNVPDEDNSSRENEVAVLLAEEKALSMDLISILKDNITKVQTDAGYIKQAQVINNNVNAIVNITKLKLDMIKYMRNKK